MGRSSATLQTAAPRRPRSKPVPSREGHRDTVEAIVVAFILALVVRGFEAQAFVIPTGSMAPTLMGRHKEIACPQCGFIYAVNASEEAEPSRRPRSFTPGICVNCRFQAMAGCRAEFQGRPHPGDDVSLRLAVPAGSGPPERWDVVVFRYPEEPEVSYIKRLVGLPGETIRIYHGDVFVKSPAARLTLARKPLRHQSATQITVYDDRHRPRSSIGKPEWQRWTSETGRLEPRRARGQPLPVRRRHGRASGPSCAIVISCLIPSNGTRSRPTRRPPREPRATLVTDFYSYNTNYVGELQQLARRSPARRQEGAWMQPHWVGDLTLAGAISRSRAPLPARSVRLELVKAGFPHRCTIDLATGTAIVTRGEDELGRWDTPSRAQGVTTSISPTSTTA